MTDTIAAVVVAGGRGLRAGGDVPKQYREIAGEPVIRPALAAFLRHPQIGAVQPVIHPQDEEVFRAATAGLKKLLPPVWGGATRQASVRAGLEAFAASAPDDRAHSRRGASVFDRRADQPCHRRRQAKRRGGAGHRHCRHRQENRRHAT